MIAIVYLAGMPLDLLLVRHGERQPVLEQSLPTIAGASGLVDPQKTPDGFMRDDMGDPQDLPKQGWGIVATDDDTGARLLGAIDELCKARKEQQGRDVKVYRVPAGMSAERAAQWMRDVYGDARVRREERPRYLLILGDLDGVSLEFQQIVGAGTFIGRLTFANTNDYSAYAQKILQWEKQPSTESSGRAWFYTVKDGTSATATAARSLVSPLLDSCEDSKKNGFLRAAEILPISYDYGQTDPMKPLLAALADVKPGLFFSASHGLGPPRGGFDSPDKRRALQGAMCLGNGKVLTANDLAGQSFLPGGVWFMLSCYGGATPAMSAYQRWLKVLRQNNAYRDSADAVLEGLARDGEKPFVAALPQTLLANPHGPIAMIAHADLAWSCAFDDMGSQAGHADRFAGLVNGIVNANRIGTAFYDLYRFFNETNADLTTRYDSDNPPQDRDWIVERSRLWMLRNDLAGYFLLGDPAARLPLAGTGRNVIAGNTNTTSAADKARRFVFMGGSAAPMTSNTRVDDAVRERAVIAVLAGEDAQNVANRMKIDKTNLLRWVSVYQEAGRIALRKEP